MLADTKRDDQYCTQLPHDKLLLGTQEGAEPGKG